MMLQRVSRLGALALVGAAMIIGGCATGTDQEATEPLVDKMIIKIDELEFSATRDLGGFGGAIAVVPLGTFNFTASFYRRDGSRETVVTSDDFEVRVASDNSGSPLPTGITFERTGAFTGTITGLADAQELRVYFRLQHKSENHTDFGPYFLIVRRLEDTGGGGGGGGGLP